MEEEKTDEEFIEEIEEKPSKWKKIFLLFIAGFLIVLMLSYFWISYGIDDIIVSLVASEKLEENKIKVNEESYLIFKGKTYQDLLKNYLENQDKEFKACLLGRKIKDYEVTEIIIPEMVEQSFNRVVSKSCPEGTIADLHSQPYRKCIESEQDLKTKGFIKQTDTERLMIIMCEKDRFSFY